MIPSRTSRSLRPLCHGATALLAVLALASCGGGGSSNEPGGPAGADLSSFATRLILVDGHLVQAWIADTPSKRAQGFMEATADQLAPLPDDTPRGMLFVFNDPQFLSFWMANTYVPLDLAYIRADGTIADIHQLEPLNRNGVGSSEAVLYALELPEGTLEGLNVVLDDFVDVDPE